jgi:predicted transporter
MSKIVKGLLIVGGAVIASAMPVFAGTNIIPMNVPEPGTIIMFAGGLGAIAGLRYYRLRKK